MTICDLCGKNGDASKVTISVGDRTLPSILGRVSLDLCEDCRKACIRAISRDDFNRAFRGFLAEYGGEDA